MTSVDLENGTSSDDKRSRKNSVAPASLPDVDPSRLPRYLRDPTRRSSLQPRRISVQGSNGSANPEQQTSQPRVLEPISNSSEVVVKETGHNDPEKEHSNTVHAQKNHEQKQDLKTRRCSVPLPPAVNAQTLAERNRQRRASHAGARPFRHYLYGPKLNRFENDVEELEIVVSPPSRLENNLSGNHRSSIKFEHLPEENESSPSDFASLTNIRPKEELLPESASESNRSKNKREDETPNKTRKISRVAPTGPFIPKPDNHLVLSLFSCLCCCPIIGIVAVFLSYQVDLKYEDGQKEKSVDKSQKAKCWAMTAVMLGMMIFAAAVMYAVVKFATAKA
ncbi:uncharacterized protein LOC5505655 [Nematostella vectensis]|uniref:uncharacterized protein LOC5505655 n=1 Tax=Nematostella vectensis TaxID=45351 RepID=UPI002076F345|nr:uncharacterized protein LOC5505655 [Nematostella vectensis]